MGSEGDATQRTGAPFESERRKVAKAAGKKRGPIFRPIVLLSLSAHDSKGLLIVLCRRLPFLASPCFVLLGLSPAPPAKKKTFVLVR